MGKLGTTKEKTRNDGGRMETALTRKAELPLNRHLYHRVWIDSDECRNPPDMIHFISPRSSSDILLCHS